MNKTEEKKLIEYYDGLFEKYGITEQSLDSGEKGRNPLRHEILLSQWNIEGTDVMDFGCGFGDLLDNIKKKHFNVNRYTGVDINPNLINIASQKHPEAEFHCVNLLETDKVFGCDFVFSSGTLYYLFDDNEDYIKKVFAKFNQISKKGFAVNFMSDKVDYQIAGHYFADPAWILNLAYQYSNNVVLRNDYMPYEFTVFVNKFSSVNKEKTVYEEFIPSL